jgi:hypothetical protein
MISTRTKAALAAAKKLALGNPKLSKARKSALLMVGLLAGGLVAYPLLPVAALPNVNYPTLTVNGAAMFTGSAPAVRFVRRLPRPHVRAGL